MNSLATAVAPQDQANAAGTAWDSRGGRDSPDADAVHPLVHRQHSVMPANVAELPRLPKAALVLPIFRAIVTNVQ